MTGGKLVPLENSHLEVIINENRDVLSLIPEVEYDLDQTKEFRYKHYPIILLILKHALKELISTQPPQPEKEFRETKKAGFLYLYDGHVPNYMEDSIKWKKTRMSVKLIVYNKNKGIYKLKNHKSDEGYAVMRRQTWQGNGWRKNEYKLINRENYYKPESDGSFSVNECQSLQEFPVLVHYFRKYEKMDSGKVKKRKSEDDVVNFTNESFILGSVPLPPSSLPGSPASFVFGHPQAGQFSDQLGFSENSNTNNTSVHTNEESKNGLPNPLLKSAKQAPPSSQAFNYSSTDDDPLTTHGVMFNGSTLSPPSAFKDDFNYLSIEPHDIKTEVIPVTNITLNNDGNSSYLNFAPRVQIPIVVPNVTIEITNYAPDVAPAGSDSTKVLLVLKNLPREYFHNSALNCNTSKSKEYSFSVIMEGLEVPCTEVMPGIVEFRTVPHQSGIVKFWLMARESASKNTLYSNVVPFYFTPSDESGRLSLAFHDLHNEESTAIMIRKFRYTTKELDLSNNSLTDVEFLENFTQLHTLILDNNQLGITTKFPVLPKLSALYINNNLLNDLEPFIEKIRVCFPNLQYLSLLGNECCPVFSKEHHYYNYRIYVISRLRKLTQLDASPVSIEEQRHASCIVQDEEENFFKQELLS